MAWHFGIMIPYLRPSSLMKVSWKSCLSRNHHGLILIINPCSCLAQWSCLPFSKSPLLHFNHWLLLMKYSRKEIWVILPKWCWLEFLSNPMSLNTFMLGYLILRMRSRHILIYLKNSVMCLHGLTKKCPALILTFSCIKYQCIHMQNLFTNGFT